MTKRITLSLITIIAVLSVVSGATLAYFSDTASSGGNVFTAGTLDLKLWGSDWHDDVIGTWTMSNMKPGDTVTATLYVKNSGSLPVKALLRDLDVTEIDGGSDGAHLGDYFYVKFWKAGYGPDKNSITWVSGPHNPDQLINKYAADLDGSCSGGDDLLGETGMPSQIDASGGNNVVALEYTFEFKETKSDQSNAKRDSLTVEYTLTGLSGTCVETGY